MNVSGGDLTRDQLRLVQAVYDRLRETGDWPKFGEIDRQLDRWPRRLDAGLVIQGIPQQILLPLGSPPASSQEYEVRLTIEGIARCAGSDGDVALLLQALRWMAKRERSFTPGPTAQTAAAEVDSEQFRRVAKIPKIRAAEVLRLGPVLVVERWGWVSGGRRTDGNWSFTLTRDVRRFRNVQTLDDYRAVQAQWEAERRPGVSLMSFPGVQVVEQMLPGPVPETDYSVELPSRSDYVDERIVREIEKQQPLTAWRCGKLIQLIEELNDAYDRGHAHSAHAMLRSILDHVPPLFGHRDFAEVVNNYGWGRTDKAYMKRLLEFRLQADDALHRQISRRNGTELSIDDLPPRRQINRLLEECVTRLEDPAV